MFKKVLIATIFVINLHAVDSQEGKNSHYPSLIAI